MGCVAPQKRQIPKDSLPSLSTNKKSNQTDNKTVFNLNDEKKPSGVAESVPKIQSVQNPALGRFNKPEIVYPSTALNVPSAPGNQESSRVIINTSNSYNPHELYQIKGEEGKFARQLFIEKQPGQSHLFKNFADPERQPLPVASLAANTQVQQPGFHSVTHQIARPSGVNVEAPSYSELKANKVLNVPTSFNKSLDKQMNEYIANANEEMDDQKLKQDLLTHKNIGSEAIQPPTSLLVFNPVSVSVPAPINTASANSHGTHTVIPKENHLSEPNESKLLQVNVSELKASSVKPLSVLAYSVIAPQVQVLQGKRPSQKDSQVKASLVKVGQVKAPEGQTSSVKVLQTTTPILQNIEPVVKDKTPVPVVLNEENKGIHLLHFDLFLQHIACSH